MARLANSTDALLNTSVSVYDGASRLTETIRDMRGTAAQVADEEINTIYGYDFNSRLHTIEDDAGNVTTYDYDELNRLKTTTYANGGTVGLTFDADDNVLTTTDQNGTLVTNQYDAINRLTTRTATLPGPVATRTFVSSARTTDIVGSTIQSFEYDGLNRMTLATDNNDLADLNDDAVCSYVYDSLSRVTSETQDYAGTAYTTAYSYVSDNRLDTKTYPGGNVVNYVYDDLDRTKGMDWTDTQSVHTNTNDAEFSFIGGGRLLTRTVPGKATRDFHDPSDPTVSGYDGLGRAVHLGYGAGNLSYGYDAVSNEAFESDSQTLGAGNDARNFESYLYDAAYRLTDFKTGVAASTPTVPTTTTQSGDTRFDGQLAINPGFPSGPIARNMAWALDGVGNWKGLTEDGVTSTNTVGSINQYTQFKNQDVDNAPNGNMVLDLTWGGEGVGSSGTDQLLYEYDAFDRLRNVYHDTVSPANLVGEYDYDAMGRRVFRSADEDHDGTLETNIRYVCSGKQVIEERNGTTGQLLREYVYGHYIDEPIWMWDGTIPLGGSIETQEFTFGQDENYNVYALFNMKSDNLTFSVAEQYRYDAYGEFTVYNGAGTEIGKAKDGFKPLSSYLFQGRRWDTESGLYNFRARYMNPRSGRFNSADPLGYIDGMGLYAFVKSRPLSGLDPLGLFDAEDMKENFVDKYGQTAWDNASKYLERDSKGDIVEDYEHSRDRAWKVDKSSGSTTIHIDAWNDANAADYLFEAWQQGIMCGGPKESALGGIKAWATHGRTDFVPSWAIPDHLGGTFMGQFIVGGGAGFGINFNIDMNNPIGGDNTGVYGIVRGGLGAEMGIGPSVYAAYDTTPGKSASWEGVFYDAGGGGGITASGFISADAGGKPNGDIIGGSVGAGVDAGGHGALDWYFKIF